MCISANYNIILNHYFHLYYTLFHLIFFKNATYLMFISMIIFVILFLI